MNLTMSEAQEMKIQDEVFNGFNINDHFIQNHSLSNHSPPNHPVPNHPITNHLVPNHPAIPREAFMPRGYDADGTIKREAVEYNDINQESLPQNMTYNPNLHNDSNAACSAYPQFPINLENKDMRNQASTSNGGASDLAVDHIKQSTEMDEKPDDKTELNRCSLCKKSFDRSDKGPRDGPEHCSQCEQSFTIISELNWHINRSQGDKKYRCDVCGFSSNSSQNLSQHYDSVHLKKKPHTCTHCENTFSQRSSLMRHIKTVHYHVKPYECTSCDRKFAERCNRDVHYRSVHCGEKPYSCEHCTCRFSQRGTLNKHRRTVHESSALQAEQLVQEALSLCRM